ncbi:MAG: substrate-binding domain-containing protein [Burkholderiaceae bacterium]
MKTSELFGRRLLRKPVRQGDGFKIGLLLPLSGAMGLVGPSAFACARLACETWNDAGGANGSEVRLTVLDAGEDSMMLGDDLEQLLRARQLDALVVLSTTEVCYRLSRMVDARVPLVYTPQFEGDGLPAWVHTIGETPERQLVPALDWMADRYGVRRWYLLGNDYCWPRRSHNAAIAHIRGTGADVVAERYVPLGERDFTAIIEDIARSRADVVLVSLIGSDSVHMCRAFGAAGLSDRVLRLSICVEENALLGMGHHNTAGMFVSAGYFATVDSEANGAFKEKYHCRFGDRAPVLNSLAQSVYEGFVHLRRQTQGSVARGQQHALASVRGKRADAADLRAAPIFMAEAEGLNMRVIQSLAGAL